MITEPAPVQAMALRCTSGAKWSFARLANQQTMSLEYIPYSRTADYKALQTKSFLCNSLNLRVITAEQKGNNFTDVKTVEKIACVNGKPVIKLKN